MIDLDRAVLIFCPTARSIYTKGTLNVSCYLLELAIEPADFAAVAAISIVVLSHN